MNHGLDRLRSLYTITQKGKDLYEATRIILCSEELKKLLFLDNRFLQKADQVAFSQNDTVTVVIWFKLSRKHDFHIHRCILHPTQQPRHVRIFDDNEYVIRKWMARQQLLKEASLPIDATRFNWEEKYQETIRMPMPPVRYGYLLTLEPLYTPFLKAAKTVIHQKIITYQMPDTSLSFSICITTDGQYYVLKPDKTKEPVRARFLQAFSDLEHELKKSRLRALFEKKARHREMICRQPPQ